MRAHQHIRTQHAHRPGTPAGAGGSRKAGRRHAHNASGVHFLASRAVIAGMLASAGVGPGDLTVELGAGPGVLTAPLAGTGSRVLAVERDADFVERLHRRFAGRDTVRVVHADLRSVPLPRRPFHVVANLPFAVGTTALRRLLDPTDTPLAGADVLVEWGLAKRLTARRPRGVEVAWWAARFELRLVRRVSAGCFSPAPRVDAAHLRIRPRPIDRSALRTLRTVLTEAYRRPDASMAAVLGTVLPRRRAHRLSRSTGISPPARAGDLSPADWSALVAPCEPTRSP